MKIHQSFPVQILLTLIIVGSISAFPLLKYGTSEIIEGSILGAILATANVLLGYVAIIYSFNKSTTTFFKVVVGGIGIRLLIMAAILLILIEIFHIHVVSLIATLGFFYVIYLILEVLFIQKRMDSKLEKN